MEKERRSEEKKVKRIDFYRFCCMAGFEILDFSKDVSKLIGFGPHFFVNELPYFSNPR
jgi:hypothetical protein